MIYNRSLEDDYLNFKKDTDDLIPFLLGRNAINYLIKSHGIRAILLPTYICSMVVDIFKYYKIEVYFYENLNKQLEVPLLSILERVKDVRTEKKLFFLWHDYLNIIGDMPDELYNFLEKSNIEVIIDATHTLPLKNYKSKNVVYGFRKLLNQPFGSLLKVEGTQSSRANELSFKNLWRFEIAHIIITFIYKICRKSKSNYVNRLLKKISAYSDYLSFDKHNFFLHDSYNYSKILSRHNSLDYEQISKKRSKNFFKYSELLPSKLIVENYDISCPLGFPLIVHDNVKSRKKLWEMGVHSFILWENLHEDISFQKFEDSKILSHSNLILPVNQDLSSNDIYRIINILND
jgi:hypothetical protein